MADQLYYCDICQKSLNSKDQFDQHKEGGPHKAKEKNLKEQNSIGTNNAASNYFSQSNDNVNEAAHVNEIPGLPKQPDASLPQTRAFCKISPTPSQYSDNHRSLNSNVLSCDLCETTFTCEKDKQNHLGGKSHAAKLKRLEEQKTTASNNSPSNSSAGFLDNTQPSQPDSSLPQARDASKFPLMPTQSSDNHRSLNSNVLSCDVCETTFTCEKDKQNHLGGKSHAAKLKRLGEQKIATANNSPSNSSAAPRNNLNDVPTLKENPNQSSQSYARMPQARADSKTSPMSISKSGTYESQNPNRREADETSSFFFRSSDLPDDLLSVIGWPDQNSRSDDRLLRAQRTVPPTSSFNDLNRPARYETNLPPAQRLVASVSAYNDLNQSQSMNLERESEQSHDDNNSKTVLLSEGNGTDFDYDFATKTGRCHVCCTTLSSEQQAVDHIRSLSHKKKKKTHDLWTREKTQNKSGRQISVDEDIEQTKRKEFVESNKKDAEHTNRKEFYQAGASHVDETCPMNQTQVKELNYSRRPTAVVTPRHANSPLPTSAPSDQAAAADESDSNTDSNPTTTNTTPTIRPQPNTRSSNEYCEICRISLTSPEHADEHYSGRQHRRRERRLPQDQRRSDNVDNDDRKKVTVSVNVEVEL